jgi:hypothetical protein
MCDVMVSCGLRCLSETKMIIFADCGSASQEAGNDGNAQHGSSTGAAQGYNLRQPKQVV